MKLRSPGFRSQLIFTAFDGRAEDRGDHWALHTLSNPNFFWGNLLIFDRPPERGDFKRWTETFQKEFTDPSIYHMTFAWDSPTGEIGDVSEFIEHGYLLEPTVVLSAKTVVKPPKFNDTLEVRPLSTPAEWEEMIQVQIATSGDHLSREEWAKFSQNQATRFQAMEKEGFGHWYGGFYNGKVVAGLGIFHRNGIARFQTVSTHPDFQRRGFCQTLVYLASLQAKQSARIDEFVMCADPGYHAIKVYESVGFQRQALEHGVYWWNKEKEGQT